MVINSQHGPLKVVGLFNDRLSVVPCTPDGQELSAIPTYIPTTRSLLDRARQEFRASIT